MTGATRWPAMSHLRSADLSFMWTISDHSILSCAGAGNFSQRPRMRPIHDRLGIDRLAWNGDGGVGAFRTVQRREIGSREGGRRGVGTTPRRRGLVRTAP